jgi:hypothetical protein
MPQASIKQLGKGHYMRRTVGGANKAGPPWDLALTP